MKRTLLITLLTGLFFSCGFNNQVYMLKGEESIYKGEGWKYEDPHASTGAVRAFRYAFALIKHGKQKKASQYFTDVHAISLLKRCSSLDVSDPTVSAHVSKTVLYVDCKKKRFTVRAAFIRDRWVFTLKHREDAHDHIGKHELKEVHR